MRIVEVRHEQLRLPLKSPFVTSYGVLKEKAFDLYLLSDEQGNQGIGELVAFEVPDYIEETLANSRQVIRDFLLPLLSDKEINHPSEVWQLFQGIQGNYMAKSAIETAVWDLHAKRHNRSLVTYFEETRQKIPVGVSVGIQPTIADLLEIVQNYVNQGYQRVKIKIAPTKDYEPLAAVRQKFPELVLMADANSAYSWEDLAMLERLDTLHLAMIEQPFHQRDFVHHQQLQQRLQTPICLDENIRTLEDVQTAYALGSCQSINLKIPRVGGITEALRILSFCKEKKIIVWLGGMFESGVGRALNLQFASQQVFQFPGDISGSNRYYEADIVTEPALVIDGMLAVPQGLGIGVDLNWNNIKRYRTFSDRQTI